MALVVILDHYRRKYKIKRKKSREVWVRKILERRSMLGAFRGLLKELKAHDTENFSA